jgi:hypothetical protein
MVTGTSSGPSLTNQCLGTMHDSLFILSPYDPISKLVFSSEAYLCSQQIIGSNFKEFDAF